MVRQFKHNKQTLVISLSVLSLIMVVSYVLGQANRNREIEIEVGAKPEQAVAKQLDSAFELMKQGKKTEALAALENILKEHPDIAMAPMIHLSIGNLDLDLGKSEQAIAQYQKILREYPDSEVLPLAFLSLGVAYESKEDFPLALTTYQQMIEKWPHTSHAAQAGYLRARRFFFQEDYPAAVEELKSIIQDTVLDSKHWKSLSMNLLAESYGKLQKYDEAIDILQQSLVDFGPSAEVEFRLARLHHQAQHYDKAAEILTKLIEAHPDYHNVEFAKELLEEVRQSPADQR